MTTVLKQEPLRAMDFANRGPRFFEDILYNISDGVYFVDRNRRILYWNKGATQLTGYEQSEILGRYCNDNILCHVDENGAQLCQNGMCPLAVSISDGQGHNASIFLRHKQGHRVPVWVRVQPIFGEDGSIEGAVEIFSNNTAQVDAERRAGELNQMAFLDHLTELPNRRYVEMSLESAFQEHRSHGQRCGILLIDIDHFKQINDSLGHACGDKVLQEVGKTLKSSLRSNDVLGRWGGDEFLAIIRGIEGEQLRMMADRCVAMVGSAQILCEGQSRVQASVSIGAMEIRGSDSVNDLLQHVDELLYTSKAAGRGRATVD